MGTVNSAITNSNPATRGSTIRFQTTFYDFDGNVQQPASAKLVIKYQIPGSNALQSVEIDMTAPSNPDIVWTGFWDTRNIQAPTRVWYSVHSDPPIPVGVGDGDFKITANEANLVDF